MKNETNFILHKKNYKKMKQAILTGFGNTEKISFREIEMPTLKKSEVLVKVVAASVNPKDTFVRKGRYKFLTGEKFPIGIGFDYSGIVEESTKTEYKKGDKVFGMINGWQGATCAEFLVAKEHEIMAAPSKLSLVNSASVPLAAQTALQALTDLGYIKSGSKVCINGGSGGVGTFAIQIAKAFDAEVTALTSSKNFDFCKSMGADFTVDYGNKDFFEANNSFDIFFDVFGNLSYQKVSRLLSNRGIFITTVPSTKILIDRVFSIFRKKKAKIVIVKSTKQKLKWLKQNIENGKINPVIDSTFSFDKIKEAQAKVETKRTKGKVVIVINSQVN
jgi:NADPH:quinone reductase-like Zn-dependent oxidoreductase